MHLQLKLRVTLVSGACSAHGLAIARALAADGCAVAMVARREDVLEHEARDIVGNPDGRAVPLVGDVTRARRTARVREDNREQSARDGRRNDFTEPSIVDFDRSLRSPGGIRRGGGISLARERASCITGVALQIDGGQIAGLI